MVSYLYSFNRCISISEDGRYLSHSNVEQYESGHPWQTPHIGVKGSDRRPFFLVLDWILVCGSINKFERGRINLQITNL